jgi:hypothetical protein
MDVGTSTLINGSGGSATLYLPNSVVYGAVGYGLGRFQYGLSDTFKWRGDIVTVGSRQLGFGFNGVGLGLNVDGVSIQRKTDEWDIVIFAGAVGTTGYSAPFLLSAASNQHIGGGIFITRKIGKDLKLYSLDAFNGGQDTAAIGATYIYRRTLSFSGAAGIVNNDEIIDGLISYRPIPNLNFYAGREDFFTPFRATGNNAGVSYSWNRFSMGTSINQSISNGKTITGESFTGGVKIGFLQEQVGYYDSGGKTLLNSNTTEKIGHWTLNESISESNGQLSYAGGGGYTSNRLSVNVSHSIVFLINGEGFEQVTGVSFSIKLPHDTSLNFTTVTTPFDKTLYLADATNWEQVGSYSPGQTVSHSISGKFLISGTCRDKDGPVMGCAIEVGKGIIAYSNTQGEWSVRVKKATPLPLAVLPAVFAAPGSWDVVTAPANAEPENSVAIVVKRRIQ